MSRADGGGAASHRPARPAGEAPFLPLDDPDEPVPVPAATLGEALKRATLDLYYHSIRFVPINLAWGFTLAIVVYLATGIGWLAVIVGAAPLSVMWVGLVRLAGLATRRRDLVLSDAFAAWRRWLVPAGLVGLAFGLMAFMLLLNAVIGLSLGGFAGWTLTAFAAWGLVFVWLFGLAFWPLLADPRGDGRSVRDAARLGALVVLARPGRMVATALVLGVAAAISAALFAALISVSAAWVALVATHVVLPLADELEAQLAGAPGAS